MKFVTKVPLPLWPLLQSKWAATPHHTTPGSAKQSSSTTPSRRLKREGAVTRRGARRRRRRKETDRLRGHREDAFVNCWTATHREGVSAVGSDVCGWICFFSSSSSVRGAFFFVSFLPGRRRCKGMQAARRGAAVLAAAFHSSAAVLSKSTPRIRFSVREKRSDAKSALRKILLNGGPCQESSNKQMRKQKGTAKSKGQHSFPAKNRHGKNKCGQNWRNFDEDDGTETPYGAFGGKRYFTWYWPGENDDGDTPSGFQWRDESQSTKSRNKFWNESDVEEEEESVHDNLQDHRISLGLPLLGPLKLDQIKSAFRASALKWHPDKHQGPSQAEAEEKFRRCVEAYNALACAFKSSG